MNKGLIRFLSAAFLFAIGSFATDAQIAKDGHADLSSHLFDKDGPVDLSGTWEFYYNRLLIPEDFDAPQHPDWIHVPGSWHRQGDFPSLGFATYRIHITLPKQQHSLSLYFPIINSSAKIWINGILEEETGVVGTDKAHYAAKLTGTLISLPEKVSDLDIVIQVANYSFYGGGIGGIPQVDRSSSIFNRMNRTFGIENFFAGSLIAMFFYQLILYFLFDRGKPYLWLSLICLGVAMRALIVHGGSFLLPNLFPSVEWEYWKKIEFGSVYAIVAIFPLYVYHLFPKSAPRKPLILFVGIAAILCAAVILTSQPTYGMLLDVCHGALLLAFIYAVFSIGKAWKSGNKDAKIILLGVLASFPFILTEILKNSVVYPVDIEFMYMVELGVLIFLLFQVYLLANHYSQSYKKLEVLNLDLEKMVTERTRQLTTANTVKDKLLSVISHDVKSPLNSLRGILGLYNAGDIKTEEFGKFAMQIEDDLNKTNLLVENILHWTTSQLKGVKSKKEVFELYPLVEENLNLLRSIASKKEIVIHHNATRNLKTTSDKSIFGLVLRNLLANAIKYSFQGGKIEVFIKIENHFLSLQVKDHGVGMSEHTMQTVLEQHGAGSEGGTADEVGTGMGLSLCREFVLKAGGQMTVESSQGQGSTLTMLLPAE